MVTIDDKQVLFSTHFLCSRQYRASVAVPLQEMPLNFVFSFGTAQAPGGPSFSWVVDEQNVIQVAVHMDEGISLGSDPQTIAVGPDGAALFFQIAKIEAGTSNLIYLSVLRGPIPADRRPT